MYLRFYQNTGKTSIDFILFSIYTVTMTDKLTYPTATKFGIREMTKEAQEQYAWDYKLSSDEKINILLERIKELEKRLRIEQY